MVDKSQSQLGFIDSKNKHVYFGQHQQSSTPHEQIDILVVDKIDNLVECIKVSKRHLRNLALKEYSKPENQTSRAECDFEENGLTIIAQYRNQRWN